MNKTQIHNTKSGKVRYNNQNKRMSLKYKLCTSLQYKKQSTYAVN